MPAFSRSQAARYIVCIRRVNETPEKSRSSALETLTPLVAPAGVAKSSCTAAADSPVRSNFLTIVLAAAFDPSAGARVDIRMSRGMSAVNAWDDEHDAPVEAGHPDEPAQASTQEGLLQPFDQLRDASGRHVGQLPQPRSSCA